jgi:hypothetical protein
LRAKKRTEEIDLKIVVEVCRGDILQPLCVVDSGTVDQYIKPAEVVMRAMDEVADSRFLRQVGLERHRLDSAAAQVFDRFSRFFG